MSTRTPSRVAARSRRPSSPALFAARARAARWRSRRPVLVALALLVLLGIGAWLLWWGPLLVVRSLDVQAQAGPRADPPAAARLQQVRALAGAPRGRPLARVDTSAMAARVETLPFVASARVSRDWPSTLRLVVRERVAVAAVPAPGGGFDLVDADGVSFEQATAAPRGLPVVQVDLASAGRDSLGAALSVLAQLPASMRASVRQVRASSPDAVRLRIGSDDVVWGSAAQTPRKAAIFAVLRSVEAKVYDVSSPETPVTR